MRLPQAFDRFPTLQRWMPRSLGFSLFLYILVGSLLELGTVLWLFFDLLEQHLTREIKGELGTKVNAVEADLARVQQSVQSLSAAVKTLHHQGIQNPELYKTLVFDAFQQRSPLVMGFGFRQTPHSIVPERSGFGPYFAIDQQVPEQPGKPLPAPYQQIRYFDLVGDRYFQQNCYTKVIEAKQPL